MEIRKKGKVKEFFKKFGFAIGGGVLILAMTITGLVVGLTNPVDPNKPGDEVDVSTGNLEFSLPMTSPNVIKDFSNTELQENLALNQWEAHLSMDLSSSDGFVYSVLAGNVLDVGYNYMDGQYIIVEHQDGFVSRYASLGNDVLVQKGDKVTAGQKLGVAAQTATNESDMDAHLHFTLSQNNKKVDPNNYIEFQNK